MTSSLQILCQHFYGIDDLWRRLTAVLAPAPPWQAVSRTNANPVKMASSDRMVLSMSEG